MLVYFFAQNIFQWHGLESWVSIFLLAVLLDLLDVCILTLLTSNLFQKGPRHKGTSKGIGDLAQKLGGPGPHWSTGDSVLPSDFSFLLVHAVRSSSDVPAAQELVCVSNSWLQPWHSFCYCGHVKNKPADGSSVSIYLLLVNK